MAKTYKEAVEVQKKHEGALFALKGVNAVGVTHTESGPVIQVMVEDGAELPPELDTKEIDGVPLQVSRGGYSLQ